MAPKARKPDWNRTAGILIIIIALFIALHQFGALNFLLPAPAEAKRDDAVSDITINKKILEDRQRAPARDGAPCCPQPEQR